ncbi:hypothetical protein RQP46_001536 [Phenoliferia psychrophenolica]
MLDVLIKHDHNEVDTAYSYGLGASEELLGKTDYKKLGIKVGTKLYPNAHLGASLTRDNILKYVDLQLDLLQTNCIDLWYFHGPDRAVPLEESLAAVNEVYLAGKIKKFGISNYMAWEVAHIVGLCEKHGWIKPTVYQGLYNAIHRAVEPELFPCLRQLGLSFYAFNPLGGGFFTGKYSRDTVVEEGTRFDPKGLFGKGYRARYWSDLYFEALDIVKPTADKHGLTMAEIALRWMQHHSLLRREPGDNVLIGASSAAQLEQNLVDLEKGPLPDKVIESLNKAWEHVRPAPSAAKYWH